MFCMAMIEIDDGILINRNNICAINICKKLKSVTKSNTLYYAQFNMNDGKLYNSNEFSTESNLREWLGNVLN